jgi:hypothetical protein
MLEYAQPLISLAPIAFFDPSIPVLKLAVAHTAPRRTWAALL